MKKFCFQIIIFLMPVMVWSQSTNISTAFHGHVKKADKYFDHLAYRNALHIYQHALEKNPESVYIKERIAMCYFKLHDPVQAEFWYSSIVKEPDIHPEAKFEYAEALSMNGKYEESKYWFEQYLKDRPNDNMAKEKLAFLRNIKWYIDDTFRFVVVSADFNTDHSEYGAHYFHDGIVYASSRDEDLFIKHKPFDGVHGNESLLNLYFVNRDVAGQWGEVVHFHNEHIKTFFHEGPMAFYDNDKKGAFTKTNLKNGKPVYDANGHANLHIYFADVNYLGSLENIEPFPYNNTGYSTAHPSFSKNGEVMFFSSTSPEGLGGSDIYYTTKLNGSWTDPVNIGPNINTPGEESFPFLANDTTLFFSSNGHGTLGGLDILVSYKRNGKWTKGYNFGTTLNSRYDDFSYVSDSTGRVGFFASNRPEGKGLDDVYFFIANYYFLVGEVRELSKEQKLLPDTKISVYDENGNLIESVFSDENGGFVLYLPFDQDLKIRGEKDGFETLEDLAFSTRGKTFGVDSLMLPMWRHKLFAKGKIYSNETESELLGATVLLHNLTDGKTDSVVLNDKSEYAFLVLPERKYRIEASKDGYITDGFNLNTKGLYEGDLLNDIVLEEIYIEKEVTLFDYNKYEILEDAKKQMDKIVRTLKRNPKATLNIGAHADSRGSDQYNITLSEKRANATVEYFVSKGIARKRIEAKGFGETFLLNRCSDGVECPEDEHSKNRRAEIKVQKEPIN